LFTAKFSSARQFKNRIELFETVLDESRLSQMLNLKKNTENTSITDKYKSTSVLSRMLFSDWLSPVPELSFLPAPYRGSTRAGERKVQDNLHAHAQNDAIFPPQIGGKTIFENTFQIWLVARFSE